MAVTSRTHSGSTESSNGRPATPGVGRRSSTRPSRTRRWKPSPAKMVIGIDSGSRSQGSVAAAWRRSGVTGSSTPRPCRHAARPRDRPRSRPPPRRSARATSAPPRWFRPAKGEARGLGAPRHPNAEPRAGGEVALQDAKWTDEAVGRAEHAARDALRRRARDCIAERPRTPARTASLQSLGVLDPLPGPELGKLALVARRSRDSRTGA